MAVEPALGSIPRRKFGEVYFAGQWVNAGVYHCIDNCEAGPRQIVMDDDGFLPDPTGGWVGRFVKVSKQLAGHH
ncbi:MAG: hypothetical protein RI591_04080 [Dehalococcoidia bacterium]|nr:hypothetical protein [Dehalococcoidia bacterium]